MVRIVGTLRTANDMPPPSTHSSASRDIDDGGIPELDVLVACKFRVIDVFNRLARVVQEPGSLRLGKTHVVR